MALEVILRLARLVNFVLINMYRSRRSSIVMKKYHQMRVFMSKRIAYCSSYSLANLLQNSLMTLMKKNKKRRMKGILDLLNWPLPRPGKQVTFVSILFFVADSEDEDPTATLTVRLQEEALQARGKLFFKVAEKV